MPQVRTRRIGLLAVAVVLISLRMAHAMGAGIQDAAGFFSKDAIATAEQQITAIHQKFGKDLRVETYAHIPTDRADQYVPEKRNEFFAMWAYQRAKALGLDPIGEDGKDEMPWQMIGCRLPKHSLPAGPKPFEGEVAQVRDLVLDRDDGGLASIRPHGVRPPDPRRVRVNLCRP